MRRGRWVGGSGWVAALGSDCMQERSRRAARDLVAAEVFGAERADPVFDGFSEREWDAEVGSAVGLQPADAGGEFLGKFRGDFVREEHGRSFGTCGSESGRLSAGAYLIVTSGSVVAGGVVVGARRCAMVRWAAATRS